MTAGTAPTIMAPVFRGTNGAVSNRGVCTACGLSMRSLGGNGLDAPNRGGCVSVTTLRTALIGNRGRNRRGSAIASSCTTVVPVVRNFGTVTCASSDGVMAGGAYGPRLCGATGRTVRGMCAIPTRCGNNSVRLTSLLYVRRMRGFKRGVATAARGDVDLTRTTRLCGLALGFRTIRCVDNSGSARRGTCSRLRRSNAFAPYCMGSGRRDIIVPRKDARGVNEDTVNHHPTMLIGLISTAGGMMLTNCVGLRVARGTTAPSTVIVSGDAPRLPCLYNRRAMSVA